jgi:hypothetical protein
VWWMIRGRKLGIRDLEARALRKIDFMIGMHDALFPLSYARRLSYAFGPLMIQCALKLAHGEDARRVLFTMCTS